MCQCLFIDVSGTHPELENLYLMLDQQFHPIPPDTTCPQSVQIFEEHKQVNNFFFFIKFILDTFITSISFMRKYNAF